MPSLTLKDIPAPLSGPDTHTGFEHGSMGRAND